MAADIDKQPFGSDDERDLAVDAADPAVDDDLEQYGVWVKVGPQDVSEMASDGDFGISDLTAGEIEEESPLTEEEEELLGDLELPPPDNAVSAVDLDDGPEDISDSDFADLGIESFGDDFDLDSAETVAEDGTEDFSDIDLDLMDSDLDDLSDIESHDTERDTADLPDLELPSDVMPGADDELNNIDLEDFDQDTSDEDLVELAVEDEVESTIAADLDNKEIEDPEVDSMKAQAR